MLLISIMFGNIMAATYEFNGPLPTRALMEVSAPSGDVVVKTRVTSRRGIHRVDIFTCKGRCERWKVEIDSLPIHQGMVGLAGTPEVVTVMVESCSGPCT